MVILRGNITISDDFVVSTQGRIREATDGLGSTMFKFMNINKDKIAQIDAKTGEVDTFGDLLQRCVRTALHMKNKKISRDHKIILCTKNHMNSVVPYIATQFLGAKVASIDPSLSQVEISHLMKQVRPKMVFIIPETVHIFEKVLEESNLDLVEIVVFGDNDKYTCFDNFLKACEKETDFKTAKIENLEETAVIHFSSGTTGLPKGICLSHRAFVGQGLNSLVTQNPDYEHMKKQLPRISFPITHLGYTSLYWVSAGIMILSSIVEGNCRLIAPDFDPEKIWNYIEKYKPVALILTPVQVMAMLEKTINVDVKSILSVIIIGSPISTEYFKKTQRAFPEADVSRCYGLTEVCGVFTTFRGNDLFHRPLMKKKIDSVGLPIEGVSYKVVDLETEKHLPPNHPGELRIKSKYVMNGYYNANSSDSFDEDGWLKTGDIVYYDEDFCLYVVDRIREAFKYQGWFITPSIIEHELMNHPAVKQAVVIGIPREDGQHAMGVVIVDKNFPITEYDIEKFVEDRVPERMRLRAGVKFVNLIPLTATGKFKRNQIRQMILDGKC